MKTIARLHQHMGLALVGVAILLASLSGGQIQSTGHNLCDPSFYHISYPNEGDILFDVEVFDISTTNTNATITDVVFRIDGQPIGQASPQGSGNYFWSLTWDSATISNGPYVFDALVYQGGNGHCRTQPRNVLVDNDVEQNFDLELIAQPKSWQGTTNVNRSFRVDTFLVSSNGDTQDISNQAFYSWRLESGTPGLLSGSGPKATYSSGPKSGVGEIKVEVSYGDLEDSFTIDIAVSNNTQSTYPIASPDDVSSNDTNSSNTIDQDDSDSTSSNETQPRRSFDLNSEGDSQLATCIRSRVSDETLVQLASGAARPTAEEFRLIRGCFAEQRFVIPVNLAPIDPQKIRDVEVDDRVKATEITNVQSSLRADGDALQFSGEADVNANIILYVFSEPLVLSTTADNEGRWSYTLEDPLDAGEHEVIVAVERDGQYVRSSGQVFAIAEAQADSENPNGLGLQLTSTIANEQSRSTNVYLLAGAGVVLAAIAVLTNVVWRKLIKSDKADDVMPGAGGNPPTPTLGPNG